MRSIRTRLRLYVPSDIDEEVREETTKLIEEAADYIDVLEKGERESPGRKRLMKWIRNDPADAEIEREPTLAYIAKLEAALQKIAKRQYDEPWDVIDIARTALDQTPPQRLDSVEAIAKALLMEGRITPNTARALMASAQSPSDGK